MSDRSMQAGERKVGGEQFNVNLQLLTITVPPEIDRSKPIPLVIAVAKDREPNAYSTPDGRRIFTDPEQAALSFEMSTDEYRQRTRRRVEAACLVKAHKLSPEEFDGPVFADGCGREYFAGVAELREWIEDEFEEGDAARPSWCFATTDVVFDFDLEDALACHIGDHHHEDAFDCLVDLDELLTFYAAWKKKQTLVSWDADMSSIVVLDQEAFERELTAARAYLEATETKSAALSKPTQVQGDGNV